MFNHSLHPDGVGIEALRGEDVDRHHNPDDDYRTIQHSAHHSQASDSFSDPVRVNDDLDFEDQRAPDVQAHGSNISVVWEATDDQGTPRVVYARSTDNGSTFSDGVVVDPEEYGSQGSPALAVNSTGTVFVAWTDDRGDQSRIFFSRSDNGTNFTDGVPVVATPDGAQSRPDVAFANGTLYVVWAELIDGDRNVYLCTSHNNGTTFGSPQRIDDTGDDLSVQNFPSVAAEGDKVFVVWHDSRDSAYLDIYGAFSEDAGTTFSEDVKVNDGSSMERHERPRAGMVDGDPCAVWVDSRGGDFDIRFAKSVDHGTTFQSSVEVSDGPEDTDQTSPSMVVDSSNRIMVGFADDWSGNDKLRFTMSRDAGSTFTASMEVSDAPDALQGRPAVTVSTYGTPVPGV